MPRSRRRVEACRLRLRPILMTCFAFILGVVPLVGATAPGPRCDALGRGRVQRHAGRDALRHLLHAGVLHDCAVGRGSVGGRASGVASAPRWEPSLYANPRAHRPARLRFFAARALRRRVAAAGDFGRFWCLDLRRFFAAVRFALLFIATSVDSSTVIVDAGMTDKGLAGRTYAVRRYRRGPR